MLHIGIDARLSSPHFGIGRYTYELITHLLPLKERVRYHLFINSNDLSYQDWSHPSVQVHIVNVPHYSVAEQLKFPKIINSLDLDLIHFPHFNGPLSVRHKSVVTIHDLTLFHFPGKNMINSMGYRYIINRITKRAKHIISISEATKHDLISILKTPEEKISVIYEGAHDGFSRIEDQTQLAATKEKYALHKPFMMYTGTKRYHKNITRLIEAFRLQLDTYHDDIELVLVGKEEPEFTQVHDAIREHGLEDRVKITGRVSDQELVDIMNLATGYVFPSLYEGFGLPILEAFSCGLPVASSNTSSMPEVAGEGNALFFSPYDVPEMAAMMHKLVDDSTLRAQLAERGQARVKDFSWKKMAEETLAVYISVIDHV